MNRSMTIVPLCRAILAVLTGGCIALPALAQERLFDLPAADIASVLPEFGRQAGVQIIAPAEAIAAVETPPIKGSMDVREALARLLAGSGVAVVSDDGTTITLRHAAPMLASLGGSARSLYDSATAQAQASSASTSPMPHSALVQESPPTQTNTLTTLEEVYVTARRQADRLQETPVSATVLSGEALAEQNVVRITDLRGAVSNLEVLENVSGGTHFTIRGIGQGSSVGDVDSKSGFYVDEMYVARQEGNNFYFYDIASFEVLKGPQGTLFGKNTTGGAVLLTTRRPTDEEGDSYVRLRAGNFERFDTEGGINIPLSETLLTRFSWRTQDHRGYTKRLLTDDYGSDSNDRSARLQVRYMPTDALTIDLLGEYSTSSTNGPDRIVTGCNPNASYMRNYNTFHSQTLCESYPILDKPYTVYGGARLTIPTSAVITDIAQGGDATSGELNRGGNRASFNDTEVTTLNARVSYGLNENMTLKSITAYRDSWYDKYVPTINAPNDIYAERSTSQTEQFSQEFNLTGSAFDGRLTYVGGVFYSLQDTWFRDDTGPDWIDPLGFVFDMNNKFHSYAAYFQASYNMTDKLELTLGARYTYDKKEADSYVFYDSNNSPGCGWFDDDFLGGIAQCAGDPFIGSDQATWNSFDPRFQISYAWTPTFFTYASVTKSYNSGGFNQQLTRNLAGGAIVPYDPEEVTSYEAGVKSEWFDRRFRINASLFRQEYEDIQTTVLVTYGGVDMRQVQSGASAESRGLELELSWSPVPQMTLNANGAWLDQEYTWIHPSITSFDLNTPVTSAPEYSYGVSGSYVFYLPSNASLTASLNYRAVGDKPSCRNTVCVDLPAYGVLGGRLDYEPDFTKNWSVGLFVTNLLDELYEISRTEPGGGMGIESYVPGRPREFGVELAYRF